MNGLVTVWDALSACLAMGVGEGLIPLCVCALCLCMCVWWLFVCMSGDTCVCVWKGTHMCIFAGLK